MSGAELHGVAGLKKHNMRVYSIVFMIYCLVAAGAFGLEDMVSSGGPGITIILLVVFPFIWAFPICNMSSELTSILPHEGGPYVWSKEALGEFWGFQTGWWTTMAIYTTNGIYITLAAGYIGKYIPMNSMTEFMVKFSIVLLFTVINLLGIKEVGRVSTILSLTILIAFMIVTVVGLANWTCNPMVPLTAGDRGILESVGNCVAICLWMYCGYECIATVAGEVEDPQIIPKGLIIAMPLIAASYVLPTVAGLASVGQWENWGTSGEGTVGYIDVLSQYVGPFAGDLLLIIAVIGNCSIFNTYLASGSRGFFVLADDNLFPKFMAKVSKKRGVPYISILSLSVVTIFLSQYDFQTLVMIEVVFILACYMIMSVSAAVLRKKIPLSRREGKYIIPGGRIGFCYCCGLPFIISAVVMLINGTEIFLIGMIALVIGMLAYVMLKRAYGGLYKINPEKYPVNPKTGLAEGDMLRLAVMSLIVGAYSFFGSFFLTWYEGEEASAVYRDLYGTGLLGDFNGMISVLKYGGITLILISGILYMVSRKIEKRRMQMLSAKKDEYSDEMI